MNEQNRWKMNEQTDNQREGKKIFFERIYNNIG